VKVVLFCGGLGLRLRETPEAIPKPLTQIGYRPILWHVMKYYAHFGHTEFILCLGYKADLVKNYFLTYDECLSNDFTLSAGGSDIHLLSSDIDEWKITFVDTGVGASIGERLKAVEPHLAGEDVFLANYSDGLSDLDLHAYVDRFVASGAVGSFLCVRPSQSFHVVSLDGDGVVEGIAPMTESNVWINGGFFAFRQEIFRELHAGEDLVVEPFLRLIEARQLTAHRYEGFWLPMDTFKDRQILEELYERGAAPWELWKQSSPLG